MDCAAVLQSERVSDALCFFFFHLHTGMIAIPAAGGATFAGGYIVKRFDLTIRGILKFCVVVTIITVGFGFVFLIHCTNVPFAGVNVQYAAGNK